MDNQPQIDSLQSVRSDHPLPLDRLVSYFEVDVVETVEKPSFNVGLSSKNAEVRKECGKITKSIGFLQRDNRFQIWAQNHKIKTEVGPLKVGDFVGCGVDCVNYTMFIVKNGVVVWSLAQIPAHWTEFYPTVSLFKEGEVMQVHLVPPFRFELTALKEQLHQQQSYEERQVYSLVHDYMRFNGYSNTAAQRRGIPRSLKVVRGFPSFEYSDAVL